MATSMSLSSSKQACFQSCSELCDVASAVLFCRADSTMLVTLEGVSSEYWIPSVKTNLEGSWTNHVQRQIIQEIFGCSIDIERIMRIQKIVIPHSKCTYVVHAVFEVIISADMKKKSKNAFGKFRGQIRWVGEDSILKSTTSLKSPEVRDFFLLGCRNLAGSISNMFTKHAQELRVIENLIEVTEDVLVIGKTTVFEQLVDAAGVTRLAQEIIYREFLVKTYPCLYMGFQAFSRFLQITGWQQEEYVHAFRAADITSRGAISFREFIYFLAAVEPGINFISGCVELRCRYIFRYLDKSRLGFLQKDDIRRYLVLVRKARKQGIDATKVDAELAAFYGNVGFSQNKDIALGDFLKAVAELKIRGTSQIFRAPNSVQKYVKEFLEKDVKLKESLSSRDFFDNAARNKGKLFAGQSKDTDYVLATHIVNLKELPPKAIEAIQNFDFAISHSSQNAPMINEIARRLSIDLFSEKSPVNELLAGLKSLVETNKKIVPYVAFNQLNFTWGPADPSLMAKSLITVCTRVKEILLKEPRMLQISSPVYIMGDLHGNINDLLTFEKLLWHLGPNFCPCSLLFLGDFVDRGLYSLEVVSYLFCHKLQTPKKINLVRGNHEIKKIQLMWTFEKECIMKFGAKLGRSVFNAINDTFDCMPVAAVIDGQIFCCHGGIPPPWLCPSISAIDEIPVVLNEPFEQSALAWELMWNDPVSTVDVSEKLGLELLANEGFAANPHRGTGHIFNSQALDKFLKQNGFSHVIRAHEVVDDGFNVQLNGKLLTVFSSSQYCGGQNGAACIMADQSKLRVLRYDGQ